MAYTVTNVCSMGKQKEGKINPTVPSLAPKDAVKEKKAKEKKKSKKDKKEPKGKSKLALTSGLGPSKKTTPAAKEPRTSPRKQSAILMLKQNPRINLETGVPYTMAAEKEEIWRLLEGRGKRKATPEKESSSSEEEVAEVGMKEGGSEEEAEKLSKKRKTSRDLVAKKKTGGEAARSWFP